jgi:glycosyltransferase involved in cell wall biosynthesis
MTPHPENSTGTPLFSIVIPVYNDWIPLDHCLQSLSQQTNAPRFEVIIADDGSKEPAPEFIRQWTRSFPLTLVQQPHTGIAAARNRGIQASVGAVQVFVDADCKLQSNCLAELHSTIINSPQHSTFQLHVIGDRSSLVGKIEELRLATLQTHTLQRDGCIRYLNTSGFAIRRTRVNIEAGLFDPAALRGEDTLLLANLMQNGELPLFVAKAIVIHAVRLSLVKYFGKGVQSAYFEARTYDIIWAKGVTIRVTHEERLRLLASMWKTAGEPSIGRLAWFGLAMRQGLRLMVFFLSYRSPHRRPKSHHSVS